MTNLTRILLKVITVLLVVGFFLLLLDYVWNIDWLSKEHLIKGIITLFILLFIVPIFELLFGGH